MKPPILHIEARKKFNVSEIDLSLLDKLPGEKISLAATVQYLDLIPKVKLYLESKGQKVIIKKGAFYDAHVLGCQPQAFDKSADALLLLADGKFHALNNAVQLQKEIYVFTTKTLEKITRQDIEALNKKTKTKVSKFLSYNIIGLIVSTKTGQTCRNMQEIKNKLISLGKKPYVFEADAINSQELDNFPNIKIWVNTACPGIAMDDERVVNLEDVSGFL